FNYDSGEDDDYQINQEFDEEFDENYVDDYFNDEYSVAGSSDNSSDSGSLVNFNKVTSRNLIIYNDDGSSTVNINNEAKERNKDGIYYGSEPVRERICIDCHKVFDLDESDWCCN